MAGLLKSRFILFQLARDGHFWDLLKKILKNPSRTRSTVLQPIVPVTEDPFLRFEWQRLFKLKER